MPNAALACEDVVCDFCGSKRRVPGTLWLGRFCFVRSKKWPNCAAHQTKKSRKGHPRRFLSWLLPRRGFLPRHDAARLGDHDARASRRGALRAVSRPRRALVRRRARHLGDLLGASRPRLSEARRSLRARSSRLDPRRPPPPPPPRARVSLRHGGVRGGAPRRGRARAPPRPPRRAPGGLPPTLRRDGGARARPDVALRRVGRAAESNGGEFSTRTHATVPPFPRSARVAPRRCSVRDVPPRRRRRRVRRVRLRARLPQIPTRASPPPGASAAAARGARLRIRAPPAWLRAYPALTAREVARRGVVAAVAPHLTLAFLLADFVGAARHSCAPRAGYATEPTAARANAPLRMPSHAPLPTGRERVASPFRCLLDIVDIVDAACAIADDSRFRAFRGSRRRVGAVDVAVRAGSPTARVRRVGARTFQRAAKRTWFPRRRRWTRRFESRWKTRRRC